VLLRDLSDIRRRDRELLTKDATIREIHHRVKNNLQTVAALLRLQARRITSPEAKAALEEAVRRVGSIAVVHDTLSQGFTDEVEFDEVADQLRAMLGDLSVSGGEVASSREGSFGTVSAEVATALAMILVEVMQNAIEHGLAGRAGHLTMRVIRTEDRLRVDVDDDGTGLPEGFVLEESPSLGLSIVRTLVDSDLGGTFTLGPRPAGGTRATVDVPLGRRGDELN
jgi:two-component sensor histidine kinase